MTHALGLEFNDIQKQIHEKQLALLCMAGLKNLLNMNDPIVKSRVDTIEEYINGHTNTNT